MRISRYHHKRFQQPLHPSLTFQANELIKVPELRIIDETGAYLDVMTTKEAVKIAEERGYDLVVVNPVANPPVAKLLNLGQYKYEKEKELKKQKQALKQVETKGIRLTPRIGIHDLEMRQKQALEFLQDGNKIKVDIILKGRERQHMDIAFTLINNFINFLKQGLTIKVEQPPQNQGGRISTILAGEKKE
ncbi:MAG: translation initiation factor IF-3 [Candidatus Magasanikbacteria bacterium]|nr:translation initiation factor IF-3 [Candidatus Magasanikbacteria bacterium]